MKTGIRNNKARSGGEYDNPVKRADMMMLYEQRNIGRVYNPYLNKGFRGNHHGYNAPKKRWVSKLEEMMEKYNERADSGEK